jgi:hypothetical protein
MPRAFGITNAAPYASAPAVGASGDMYWNSTEKVLYVSDGTSWQKTPTAGIADLAVTTAKLAIGATVARQGVVAATAGPQAGATESTLLTLSAQAYRGGLVLVLCDLTMLTYLPDDSTMVLRLYVDTTLFAARNMRGGVATTTAPLGMAVIGMTQPAAGSHDISARWIRTAGTGTWALTALNLIALEFG